MNTCRSYAKFYGLFNPKPSFNATLSSTSRSCASPEPEGAKTPSVATPAGAYSSESEREGEGTQASAPPLETSNASGGRRQQKITSRKGSLPFVSHLDRETHNKAAKKCSNKKSNRKAEKELDKKKRRKVAAAQAEEHEDDPDVYEVERIVSITTGGTDGNTLLARVRWTGYEEFQDTWEELLEIYPTCSYACNKAMKSLKTFRTSGTNFRKREDLQEAARMALDENGLLRVKIRKKTGNH